MPTENLEHSKVTQNAIKIWLQKDDWTDSRRSDGVRTVTHLMWFNQFAVS